MNFLLTGAWADARKHIERLEKMGHKIVFMQQEKEALACDYDWVEGTICNGLFLTHPIMQFQNLRYIQLTSAGFDRVPMDYVRDRGIEIHNARGVYSIPMAEFAVCGVLQMYKKMRFFDANQKKHKWVKYRELLELSGKTIVIVGCGSVGTECAKRFQAFGCRVIGVDLFPREDSCYDTMVSLSALSTVLPQADAFVLTLPLTEQTRHMISWDQLRCLKPTCVLVNIARGAVVDTEALTGTIDNIGGAVLDVFEEEPLSDASVLWEKENVIITPHNSFVGDGNQERLSKVILDNLQGK